MDGGHGPLQDQQRPLAGLFPSLLTSFREKYKRRSRTLSPRDMSDVERSAYRQPVTASGLEAIEGETLTWLDDDMYNKLNTGLLEQYLEEKNLEESFEISHWDTRKVLIGILVGAVFSGVTAYIGLKIGLAVSAAWYVAYLLGMALQWSPSEVNIATSATTEGMTTAYYIKDSLKDVNVKVSKLAHGLPVGGEIENLDDGTLFSAFKNRNGVGNNAD